MYSTHNEGKSEIGKRFIKTFKAKICEKLTPNNSKSDLVYLNKLVDQYNNTYCFSIDKNLLIMIILIRLKKFKTNPKAPRFKVDDGLPSIKYLK